MTKQGVVLVGLILLALSVLFPLSGFDDYTSNRSYKFLDAALVMGLILLASPFGATSWSKRFLLIGAVVLIALPIFQSDYPHDALLHAIPLLFLILGWIFWSLERRKYATHSVKLSFFTAYALLVLWALSELLPLLFDGSISHQETYMVQAGLGHRNLLVQTLIVFLPLIWMNQSEKRWERGVRNFLLILTAVLIVLLLNRSGWIALILLGGFWLGHRLQKGGRVLSLKQVFLIFLPLGGLLFFVDEFYTIWHHVEMTLDVSEGTTRDRLLLLQRSVEIFAAQPFLGHGYGMWPIQAMAFDQAGMLTETARMFYLRPHNDYLRLFAEGGIMTGAAYSGLHLLALFKTWRAYSTERTQQGLGLFLLWLMIVFASASNYLIEQPVFMLLQSYAIAAVFPLWSTREEEGSKAPHTLRILSIGLWVSIVLICFNQAGARILFQKAEAAYQREDVGRALVMLHEVDNELDLDEALRPFSYHDAMWNDALNADQRIERFTAGLQYVPNHPHLHEALGVTFLKKNDTLSALAHFKQAVENTPRYQAAWLGIAEVFAGQGHWREAFDAILQADATQPTERYKSLGAGLAQDSLTQLAAECPDRKMQLTLEAIRNTPDWSLDILRKTVGNRVDFDHQAYVDACYYMLRHCDEYEDCDLAETMINRYLPNGIEDLNLEATEE